MKTLANYTEEAMTNLLNECGAFFAFSNDQFAEKQKEGVTYVALGGGLIVEKEHVDKLVSGIERISEEGIKQDLAENGREAIIRRELENHECYYTGDITDCIDSLDGYGITAEEVRAVFDKYPANLL